ncbi:hypothetical protein GCM10028821_16560 [Hymenobacter jeollabukensis]
MRGQAHAGAQPGQCSFVGRGGPGRIRPDMAQHVLLAHEGAHGLREPHEGAVVLRPAQQQLGIQVLHVADGGGLQGHGRAGALGGQGLGRGGLTQLANQLCLTAASAPAGVCADSA